MPEIAPLRYDARAKLLAPLLRVTDLAGALARRHYPLMLAISSRSSALSESLSPHAALRAARRARREVPAYRDFLAARAWNGERGESAEERLRSLPVMDKAAYILPYSTEARCVGGTIPLRGASIDESSGASGKPQVWIRGAAEREEVQRRSGMLLRYLYGQETIAINGFALGTWVSGLHASEVLRRNGPVKSTGPDVEKALETFEQFGSARPYVITGYPPFLKYLVDLAEARNFDWSRYTVHGIVGGEGMSEYLRTYLLRRFRTLYSAYGASDLDAGIATEMPLTVAIRRAAAENEGLRRALFGEAPRLPMLFQYNPLDYYIETNERRELLITVNRLSVVSPRIRYNIHDEGGTISFAQMRGILREYGVEAEHDSTCPSRPIMRLPFLYVFGRSDGTISYWGQNIFPEQIADGLYADADDAARINGFCLEYPEASKEEVGISIDLELFDAAAADVSLLLERCRQRIFQHLVRQNDDFRALVERGQIDARIIMWPYALGTGPFAENARRIKRRYIVESGE